MALQFHHKSDKKIRSGMRFRDAYRLMQFPESPYIKVILVNTLAMSLLGLAIPLSVQLVINSIARTAMRQPLIVLCMLMLAVLSFSGLLQTIQTYTVEMLKRRVFVRFGLVIAERITHYKDEIFRKEDSPALTNRYFDTIIMQSSMVTFFVDGFGFLVMFLVGFGLLTFYHPYFLAFSVLMVIFLIVNWLLFGPDGVRAGSPEADGKYDLVGWIEELSRERNLFSSEHGRAFSDQKITTLFNQWLEKRNTLFHFQFRQHIGLQLFSVFTNVMLLFLGGMLVLERQLTVGQLVAAALVVGNIIASLPRLQNFFFAVYDYSTSLDKIAQFYDPPLEEEPAKPVAFSSYEVEYRDVVVVPDYRFKCTIPVGKRVSVFVKSFSTIEVMYDLLMGFVSPHHGDMFVGGQHHNDIDVGKLRNKVQIIRNNQFFAGTIKENLVGLSGRSCDLSEIHRALEQVGLWDTIQELPLMLDTPIRPNGYPLSRSHILTMQAARAVLAKPKILFVSPDFDQISDKRRRHVFQTLMDPSHGWTVLFFTQHIHNSGFDEYMMLSHDGLHTVTSPKDLVLS